MLIDCDIIAGLTFVTHWLLVAILIPDLGVIVKSGVWHIESSGGSIDVFRLDTISEVDSGARQGSCRLSHALLRFSVEGSMAVLTAASRSGFKVTTAIGDQLRVGPDRRCRWRSLSSS